jgi:hypothetical protein
MNVITEYWSIRQCSKNPSTYGIKMGDAYGCVIRMCKCGLEGILDFAGLVIFPAYTLLSLLLYAVSTEFAGLFTTKTRKKIRFWAKSFIIGAIIAIIFSVVTPGLVDLLV